MNFLLKKAYAKGRSAVVAAAVAVVPYVYCSAVQAAISMQNVTAETDKVSTWALVAGGIAIAAAVIGSLYVALRSNPFLGVALVILTVICGTLFVAALA